MDELFPAAREAIEAMDDEMELKRSAVSLTLLGDMEFDDLDDQPVTGDDEEIVEMIATFEHDDEEYVLVRIVDPFLLIAKDLGDGQYNLLTEEEAEVVGPLIEEHMSAEWE